VKNETVYVAGHQGMLGSALLRRLYKEECTQIITADIETLDLRNKPAVFDFFNSNKPAYVFLLAAEVGGIAETSSRPADFLRNNLEIQTNVIEAARLHSVKKMLFTASSCVYPSGINRPLQEKDILSGALDHAVEGYALAKIAGIKMCEFYRRQYGCDYVSVIPSNLYGPGCSFDPARAHMLPALILKCHEAVKTKARQITVWGTGKPRREFLYVDDCADALVYVMKNYSGNDPVNIGCGKDYSILEYAEIISRTVCGRVLNVQTDPSKPDGAMRKLLDVSFLSGFGWSSSVSIEEGIARTYQSFLSTAV